MTQRDEYEIVRVPLKLQKELNIKPQSILKIRSKNKVLSLRVRNPFEEDISNFGEKFFLTEGNHNLLQEEGEPAKIKEVHPFLGLTLGCDPEFFLVSQAREIQIASRFIGTNTSNPLGVRIDNAGYVGVDGASTLAELRPDPVILTNQDRLYQNIQTLLLSLDKKKIIDTSVSIPCAYSYYKNIPAGFHIHFGLEDVYVTGNSLLDGKKYEEFHLNQNEATQILPSLVVKSLDYHLGFVLSLLDKENFNRTWNSSYGRAGDYRLCKYTLEYRVPGAFFLVNPFLTKGLISTAALIVSNTVSFIKEITDNYNPKKVFDYKPLEKEFNNLFSIPDTMLVKRLLDGEETMSSVELEGMMKNIFSNLDAMNGRNPYTTSFLLEAKNLLAKNKDSMRPTLAKPSIRNLVENWRHL